MMTEKSELPCTSNDTSDNELALPRGTLSPADLEKLGRQRPEVFKTSFAEIGFCFSLLASMFMAEYFISGFGLITPTLASALDIPANQQIWPASAFSLVTGAVLLPTSRIADVYGSYRVFVAGLFWFAIWSLITGFSRTYIMLIVCRAIQGLGPAAFLPSGVMLLGSTYRPGPRKNLVFSLYGALSPVGFFTGIFSGAICEEYLSWGWYFWIGAIVLFIVAPMAMLAAPSEPICTEGISMDWWGLGTIVPGLLLVVFAFTDSAHTEHGWAAPQIYLTFTIGMLFLIAAFYTQGWVAKAPLLPFDLFCVKGMVPLMVADFFSFGVFGIYLIYSSFYIQNVREITGLLSAAWYAPMAAGGLILATVSGFTLHLIPGKLALLISGIGYLVAVVLFATIPSIDSSYWAYVFPAMLGATLGVDVTYGVSNIFITTSLPKRRQGLAGAVINSVLFLGMSFFLGVADMVESSVGTGKTLNDTYKSAFWFATGCSVVSLAIIAVFVRMGRAKSDLTVDERAEQPQKQFIPDPVSRALEVNLQREGF